MFYKNITAPRSVVDEIPCFLNFGHDMRMTIRTNYMEESNVDRGNTRSGILAMMDWSDFLKAFHEKYNKKNFTKKTIKNFS